MKRITRIILGAFTCSALSACGSNVVVGGSAAPETGIVNTSVVPVDDGALRVPLVYSNAGVSLDPPGAAVAKVSPLDAYNTCMKTNPACVPGVAPHILLALGSIPGAGAIQPDNSIKPLIDRSLVYALTWTGVSCKGYGSGPIGNTSPPKETRCTVVSLIDATTGAVVYGFSGSAL